MKLNSTEQKTYFILPKPNWLKRMFFTYCPKCNMKLRWNDGWDKWDNCDNCGNNPNYSEEIR